EAEQAAADDGCGDERSGLRAMNALDEFCSRLATFGLDVDDLSADHAGRQGAANACAKRKREFTHNVDDRSWRRGQLRNGLEGERLQRIAGEDGGGFAEGHVAGGLTAAQVIVV